ncbi:MAG: beta-lactamase family protein [Actinomycetales bacterium]|nr:beta-lactamase family protein [Actinomycetales bacterium]
MAELASNDLGDPGVDPRRIDRLVGAFRDACARGHMPGGQLAVRRAGRSLVDEAVGVRCGFRESEARPRDPVTPESEFLVFSASKPVVGVAIAMLESRGVLDPSAPVAQYWPEFGAEGKAEITVLDVLTHRAGVFAPELRSTPSRWPDWDGVCATLAAAAPEYPRGTFAYMPYEFGWILGEVIRRVTGKSFGAFVHDEIAEPLGWEHFTFGVSSERARALARTYWLGAGRAMVAGDDLSRTFEQMHLCDEVATSIVPGAGLVTNARTLARFYEWVLRGCAMPGGEPAVRPDVLGAYTTRAHFGFDRSNRVPMAVGRGFIVGTPWPSAYGMWGTSACFGHQGAFCTLGFADRDRDLAVAIVTNGNHGMTQTARFFTRLVGLARGAVTA